MYLLELVVNIAARCEALLYNSKFMQLPFAMDGVPKKFMVFSPFNIYERTLFTLWKFCVGSKQFTTVWSVESVRVQQPEQAHWNVCRIACFIIIIIIIGTNCSFIFSFSVRAQILFTYFLLCRLKGCICCRMGWDEMEWLLLLDQI